MIRAEEILTAASPSGFLSGVLKPSCGRRTGPSAPSLADEFFFLPFHEVNQRCIQLLVEAAKVQRQAAGGLVSDLHELLQTISPIERTRAAQRAFLLVDLQFADIRWWVGGCAAKDLHLPRLAPGHVYFPRAQAIRLARATLTLAWHSIRSDQRNAHIFLGMTETVAQAIYKLKFEEIDRIAERQSKQICPRWSDRPGVWREILSGRSELSQRDADLHGVQLLTGELLASQRRPNPPRTQQLP